MQVLLGISGGIAAYKTPDLVRQLRRRGHHVRCVLTANAGRLVACDALAAVSGERVHDSAWTDDGSMPHIELARWAEALLIAPLSADCAARLALGLADDLLGTLFLALDPRIPVWLAPAMNTSMWEKPVVQSHLATLIERGAQVIAPVSGSLACGEEGVGAMAEVAQIAEMI